MPRNEFLPTALCLPPTASKPRLLLHHIRLIELLISLGEIHDPLDDPNDVHHDSTKPARQHRDQQHDQPRPGHAKDKLVNPQPADEYPADSRCDLLTIC